jgi:hypothetical protein
MVEPYLRDFRGSGGIEKFWLVCNESNNTDAVLQAHGFVGDIYIVPPSSINFVQLNFNAVNGVALFNEITGNLATV